VSLRRLGRVRIAYDVPKLLGYCKRKNCCATRLKAILCKKEDRQEPADGQPPDGIKNAEHPVGPAVSK
jgi:hypothetical protein